MSLSMTGRWPQHEGMELFGVWSLLPLVGPATVAWYVLGTSGLTEPVAGVGRRSGTGLGRPTPAET